MIRSRLLPKSIVTKLIMMNALILFAVAGVIIVNLALSRQTENTVVTLVDRDVSQAIRNEKLSRNLNQVTTDIHVLLSTFTLERDNLSLEANRILPILQDSISSSSVPHELDRALRKFQQAVEILLNQCTKIDDLLKTTDSIEKEIVALIDKLERKTTDIIIERRLEGREYELYSFEQVSALIPDFKNLLLQISMLLSDSERAHFKRETSKINYEGQVLAMLGDLESEMTAATTAGEDLAPLGKSLIRNVNQYKTELTKLFQTMRALQTKLKVLYSAQSHVMAIITEMDTRITNTTEHMREHIVEYLQSSGNMSLFLSLFVVAVLIGVTIFGVKIVKPIQELTVSASEIAAGNLERTIRTSSSDEIGILARSFVKMRDAIKEKMDDLVQKNDELFQEILKHKRTADALRESEEIMRSVLETSPVGISIYDETGQCFIANDSLAEMIGATKEQVLQQNYNDLESWKTSGTLDKVKLALKENIIKQHELIGESTFGQKVQFDCYLVPFSSGRLLLMVHDITERKQIERELRESEEKYRRIFENSVVGIFQSTPEGRFINVNHALAKMLGYSSPIDLISSISDISEQYYTDPEDRHEYQQILQKDGIVENFEFRARRKNGSQIWVSNSTRAYFDQNGKIVSYEGIVFDITKRKRVEEEHFVLEAQLQQSQKMESIGTLAGGIAHEFNNILGIIIGNTDLAMDDVLKWNPARFNLEEIRTACLRAKEVVQQLLSFARKTKLEKKPINISSIVMESLKLLRSSIPTSIEIRQNINRDVDPILADATQINQLLINLCTNAFHAMPDGGVLEINLKNTVFDGEATAKYHDLKPGRYINLTVGDNGQGISQENIDRIFEPYFTTKEVNRGTGMGLAVVHGIVNGHNGLITVESEPGKGTTFSIFFPVVEEQAVVDTETDEQLPTGNERVLFIDDELALVNIARKMLERLGYEVDTQLSPIEALALIRSQPDYFDLVITDLAMPKMTGDHLIQEILNIRPDIPVILCTGFSEKIDEKKAKNIGAADYIEKPLDKHDFAFKVRKVLDEN